MEVLSKRELVTYKVKGLDPENQLKMVGERIAIAMNYQLDCDMPNWREEQEKLLYSLPNYGSVFKKTMFDSVTQKAEVTRICFPDFAINQSTESLEDARSFSHVFDVSRNTAVEKINSGIWIDYLEERKDKTRTDGDEGTNAEQEVLHAKDNNESFIEQHCFFDLDGDGYEEPYIVTICRKNCKVCPDRCEIYRTDHICGCQWSVNALGSGDYGSGRRCCFENGWVSVTGFDWTSKT